MGAVRRWRPQDHSAGGRGRAWPGPAPAWLLVLWVVGLSSGGPGSAVAFDFARTFSPSERLGSATGIIIMTGFGDIPSSVRAMKLGAVDFLPKPFREQDLLDAVSRAIRATVAWVRSRVEPPAP